MSSPLDMRTMNNGGVVEAVNIRTWLIENLPEGVKVIA